MNFDLLMCRCIEHRKNLFINTEFGSLRIRT